MSPDRPDKAVKIVYGLLKSNKLFHKVHLAILANELWTCTGIQII